MPGLSLGPTHSTVKTYMGLQQNQIRETVVRLIANLSLGRGGGGGGGVLPYITDGDARRNFQ